MAKQTRIGMSIAALSALPLLISTASYADDAEAENPERNQSVEIIRDYMSRHRLAADAAPDEFLELQPEPLLVWTNPTRTRHFGGVYVWTRNDRPLALCGIHVGVRNEERYVSREFHTLTEEGLQAQFDDEQIWAPASSAIEFLPVPDADPPAESPAARLRQMKAIATQFTITISKQDTPSERLRVLPRPIYRYADAEAGVADGTIIAFVQGTDPEAFLLVEARSNEGHLEWRYAIARCTAWGVTARVGGDTVYEVPPYYGSGAIPTSAPFYCLHQRPLVARPPDF